MADEGNKPMDLPKGFTPVLDLIEEDKIKPYSFVDVIGLVRDCRLPFKTRGDDWKCQLRIIDFSTQHENYDVEFDIFRSESTMPKDVGAGDVVVISQARVQKRGCNPLSLLTNIKTAIHFYPASKIPKPPQPASGPLMHSQRDSTYKPLAEVRKYISWLYHTIDKSYIPAQEDFQATVVRSLNIKNKLCELKDARDGSFHDLIVQVVQEPFDYGDKMRLYVSDYTENSSFFQYKTDGQMDGETGEDYKDGDPFGYTSAKTGMSNASIGWTGPFGKKTMQVTCYEPHAESIRTHVKLGTWVRLSNVQIKYGSNGHNLEGFLREDRNAFGHKISVDVLDPQEGSDIIHPQLKNSIRRKRDYEKEIKARLKDIQADQKTSKKRPATEPPEEKRLSRKQKRQLKRAQATAKAKQGEASEQPPPSRSHPSPSRSPPPPPSPSIPNLNHHVVCENHGEPTVSVPEILRPATHKVVTQGVPLTIKLPFTCAKYRANVRVIDFHPPRLQDFACARKKSEYDALSDYSGSDSESDDDDNRGTLDSLVGERVWEWRFALRLQDAAATNDPIEPKIGGNNSNDSKNKNKSNSVWVLVGNLDAQLLTGLDACDLRAETNELAKLRERMFILWGELEEQKAKELAESSKTPNQKKMGKAGKKLLSKRPPLDSSDNEEADVSVKEQAGKSPAASNRPFSCCIRQYGVQVKEPNPAKANAGNGKRWERVFGIYGTKVCGV